MKNKKILPSMLSADFSNLKSELERMKENGMKEIHYDVMDGNFVSNISFGNTVLDSVKKIKGIKYDVHLMVADPEKHIEKYINSSVSGITWHHEAITYKENHKLIKNLKEWNPKLRLGISIKPKTNVEQVYEFLPLVDIVLVMSVEPGMSGQEFIPGSLQKIKKLKEYIKKMNLDTKIYVDGGVNDKTAKDCFDNGADVLIAGSYLFKSKNVKKSLEALYEKN